MANINLTGILRDPTGEFSYRNQIRFTHNTNTGQTLKGFRSVHDIEVDGAYDIDVEYGNVSVETFDVLNRSWIYHGTFTINSDTPATDIPTLLGITTPATNAELLVFQALAADAAQDAADAANSAAEAASSASSIPDIPKIPIEQASGGMNVYRLDSNGNYNMMVKIPMFTNKVVNDTLGTNWLPESDPHPAFIRPDGTTMPWFEIGMYQASNDGTGKPVSAAYKDPYTTINYDSAKSKCSSMGAGWGLMSNAQWAAVSLWCLMNDYQPLGNTYYGLSHTKNHLAGIRQDGGTNGDASGTARILTGSGPTEFRHNKAEQGISDMVGNVGEWVDGMKIVDGQIFIAETERQAEIDWVAQPAFLDAGNKLNSSKTGAASTSTEWSALGKDASYAQNQLLQQHCVEPTVSTTELNGTFYYNNDGERFPRRGGRWRNVSNAGLGALDLYGARSGTNSDIGFRPAFFE